MQVINRAIKDEKYLTPNGLSLPSVVMLDQHSVSPCLVDELVDAQCDWLGILRPEWEVDSSCLKGAGGFTTQYSTIQELVDLIRQSRCELTAIEDYWVHTLCLQAAGLGRVRLVLRFDSPDCTGGCIVCATNRLDWSPRKVLTQWRQSLPPESLNYQVYSKPTHSYSVPLNFTSCSAALAPAL